MDTTITKNKVQEKNEFLRMISVKFCGMSSSGSSSYNNKVNAVIYIRVSSGKQQEESMSIDTQEMMCRKFCREKGYNVAGVFTEVQSGRITARPVLKEAMKMIGTLPNTVLVVFKTCRFARNTRDGLNFLEELKKKGSTLISTSENFDLTTTFGRATFRMLLSNAESESDTISDRVRASIAYRRCIGSEIGRAPFGQLAIRGEDRSRHFEVNRDEQEIIRFITMCRTAGTSLDNLNRLLGKISPIISFEPLEIINEHDQLCTHLVDGLTYQNIAELLNEYQITKRGNMWTAGSVKSCVASISEVERALRNMTF